MGNKLIALLLFIGILLFIGAPIIGTPASVSLPNQQEGVYSGTLNKTYTLQHEYHQPINNE
ncbi:hypothetical protein [Microbulbifer sp. 2205BS26-8]|uniref:hypothetical protein n=1 Tax=Microbulbifer sp. 2205BS26-8 TaxID=3064386 RepID=UPI00273EF7E1|nr:hypothetical protein [Microbulbifer sp. 2205BS26-8]MDP5209322.1 hypothetical protein [Microbulbifer sp. 2205BS26-8]